MLDPSWPAGASNPQLESLCVPSCLLGVQPKIEAEQQVMCSARLSDDITFANELKLSDTFKGNIGRTAKIPVGS